MRIQVMLFAAFVIILAGGAWAEIFINNINEVYNSQDRIFASVSVQKQKNSAGYLEGYLDCGSRLLVHKQYYYFEKDKKRDISIEFPASIEGECHLEVDFDGEKEASRDFEISKDIEIEYSLNNKLLFPDEKLIINGTAIKKSGEKLTGFIRVSLEGVENKTIEATDGDFSLEILIKKDAYPGIHELEIEAFEKDEEEQIINYGRRIEDVEIKGKATLIKIESVESIKPSFNFSAKVSLLDQSGAFIDNGTIIVKLLDPSDNAVSSKGVESGRYFSYNFSDNATRGFWELWAYYGSIYSSEEVLVEINTKIFVDVINNSNGSYVKIKNTGNTDYNGTVSLSAFSSLGEENVLPIAVGLGLGEERQYPLELQGMYDLEVEGRNFSGIYFPVITAFAVSPDPKIDLINYVYFLIILAALGAVYLFTRRMRKFGKGRRKKATAAEKGEPLVMAGERAYMIFFRFDKFVAETKEIIEKENLSLTKLSDNLYYVLFYQDPGRTEISSYTLAKKVRNKAMSMGQGVSIAINSGEFKNKEKFLKEFSLLTRKMVDYAKGGILVSEPIFRMIKVKAEKAIVFKEDGKTYRMYKVG